MVLPLIIIGGIAILFGVAFYQNSNTFGQGFLNLTKSKEQKNLDTKKDSQAFDISKRGAWNNTIAFFVGEEAYQRTTNKNYKTPQKTQTGEPHTSKQEFFVNQFDRNPKGKRGRYG